MQSTKNIQGKSVALVAALSISGSLLTACSSAPATTQVASDCKPAHPGLNTITPGTLTVGVPENLPYTQNKNGDADGFEIDLVKKLAAAECLNLKYEVITYGNGIPMITAQHKVDMITGGWYITPDRAKQVDFTTPTFYDSMAIISADGLNKVSDLEGLTATGSVAGFSWEADMSKVLGSKLKTYPSTVEAKQDLTAGRVQATLDGYAVAVESYKGTNFKVEIAKPDKRIAITTDQPQIGFPISKENPKLTAAFSELINEYREDGTLTKVLSKWNLPADLVVPADKVK